MPVGGCDWATGYNTGYSYLGYNSSTVGVAGAGYTNMAGYPVLDPLLQASSLATAATVNSSSGRHEEFVKSSKVAVIAACFWKEMGELNGQIILPERCPKFPSNPFNYLKQP